MRFRNAHPADKDLTHHATQTDAAPILITMFVLTSQRARVCRDHFGRVNLRKMTGIDICSVVSRRRNSNSRNHLHGSRLGGTVRFPKPDRPRTPSNFHPANRANCLVRPPAIYQRSSNLHAPVPGGFFCRPSPVPRCYRREEIHGHVRQVSALLEKFENQATVHCAQSAFLVMESRISERLFLEASTLVSLASAPLLSLCRGDTSGFLFVNGRLVRSEGRRVLVALPGS